MRLIDSDKLCNDLMDRWSIADKEKDDLIRSLMADVVTPIVVSQPTVDAVPVVRCRNCRFSQRINDWVYYCYVFNVDKILNQYCDMGERKDGGDEKAD